MVTHLKDLCNENKLLFRHSYTPKVCPFHSLVVSMLGKFYFLYLLNLGGSDGKASVCNAGDLGSLPGSGKSLGEGNGNPLQYSCLENPMDRGAW